MCTHMKDICIYCTYKQINMQKECPAFGKEEAGQDT